MISSIEEYLAELKKELSGYAVGYSGQNFIPRRRMIIRMGRWIRKRGAAAIFVFALAPFLPMPGLLLLFALGTAFNPILAGWFS